MLTIDGSKGEGGGQIIRTSIALSAVTQTPVKIVNIRANRPKPGLAPQHLTGIQSAANMCNAKLEGVEIGSTEVKFTPVKITGGTYKIDIGTAGSITLVLQTLIPIGLHAEKPTELEIIGGTDVKWSPSIHYTRNILMNTLELFGMKRQEDFDLQIIKYGFYPKGGGKIKFTVKPFDKFKKLNIIEQGKLIKTHAISVASETLKNSKVAERQIPEGSLKIDRKEIYYAETLSSGTSLHLHSHFKNCKLGATVLGERGKRAEQVGEDCANLLKSQIDSGACFDEWMTDQILPYLALAGTGKVSVAKITNHAKTNMEIIEQFLPVRFEITEGNPPIIEVMNI